MSVDRLRAAGATDEEIEKLDSESFAAKIETLAEQDIRELLDELRKAGRFTEAKAKEIVQEVEAEIETHTEPAEKPKAGK